MIPHFSPSVRRVLLDMPLYTPALLETGDNIAIVLRVEKLAPFRKPLPFTVRVGTWQDPNGVWVVAVVFRVSDNADSPLEGDAYLNPRQTEDWANIDRLSKQEVFPFIFCNPRLTEAVGKVVPWAAQQRAEIQAMMESMEARHVGLLTGEFDHEFEVAKIQFQGLYSVHDLLQRAE